MKFNICLGQLYNNLLQLKSITADKLSNGNKTAMFLMEDLKIAATNHLVTVKYDLEIEGNIEKDENYNPELASFQVNIDNLINYLGTFDSDLLVDCQIKDNHLHVKIIEKLETDKGDKYITNRNKFPVSKIPSSIKEFLNFETFKDGDGTVKEIEFETHDLIFLPYYLNLLSPLLQNSGSDRGESSISFGFDDSYVLLNANYVFINNKKLPEILKGILLNYPCVQALKAIPEYAGVQMFRDDNKGYIILKSGDINLKITFTTKLKETKKFLESVNRDAYIILNRQNLKDGLKRLMFSGDKISVSIKDDELHLFNTLTSSLIPLKKIEGIDKFSFMINGEILNTALVGDNMDIGEDVRITFNIDNGVNVAACVMLPSNEGIRSIISVKKES